ncbi:MAG: hypothetical protein M3Z00_02190 [Actinomycetota bacterium]|nr:hypothetical protein [Actinomycetota bacterium]
MSSPAMLTPRSRTTYLSQGFTDAEIRRELSRGALTRICPGIYVDAQAYQTLTPSLQYTVRVRAEAARTPGLVVSHISAAALHGLPLVRTSLATVHFTRPGSNGSRRTKGRRVHVGDLPGGWRATAGGIDLTAVARTVVDVGRTHSTATAIAAADAALRLRLTDAVSIAAALTAARFCQGIPRAHRALRLVDGRAESPGETLLRLAIRGGGLPEPELQVEIRDEHGQFVGRTDLALLAYGILIEFDGRSKYTDLLLPGQNITDVVLDEKHPGGAAHRAGLARHPREME